MDENSVIIPIHTAKEIIIKLGTIQADCSQKLNILNEIVELLKQKVILVEED